MVSIQPFKGTDSEYEAAVGIWNAIWTEFPKTVEEWKVEDSIRDKKYLFQRIVVEKKRQIVAYGSYGDCFWAHTPGKYLLELVVHPTHQRRGIGTALYDHIYHLLKERDPIILNSYTREDQPQAVRFLAERGFRQNMRLPCSVIDVSTFDHKPFAHIPLKMSRLGINMYSARELEALDPDWRRKVWDMEWEIVPDIPSPDPLTRRTFEHFVKHLQAPGFHPDAYFVAIDNHRYVGLSYLWLSQARKDILFTGLTGVVRSHRRRNIATALKLRAIEFAQRYGAKSITTDNEENNPMYILNMKLGFKPRPAWLSFRKNL